MIAERERCDEFNSRDERVQESSASITISTEGASPIPFTELQPRTPDILCMLQEAICVLVVWSFSCRLEEVRV